MPYYVVLLKNGVLKSLNKFYKYVWKRREYSTYSTNDDIIANFARQNYALANNDSHEKKYGYDRNKSFTSQSYEIDAEWVNCNDKYLNLINNAECNCNTQWKHNKYT